MEQAGSGATSLDLLGNDWIAFELPGAVTNGDRQARIALSLLLLPTMAIIAVFLLYLVPAAVHNPSSLDLCGGYGTCVSVPGWAFLPLFAVYTFAFAVLPGIFAFYLVRALLAPKACHRLLIGPQGLILEFPKGRVRKLLWQDPSLRLELLDQTAPAAFDSQVAVHPLTLRVPKIRGRIVLTRQAFDGMLEALDYAGLDVTRDTPMGRGDRDVGTVRYTVRAGNGSG